VTGKVTLEVPNSLGENNTGSVSLQCLEPDASLGPVWRRLQQWKELLIQITQGAIMLKQYAVDFRQSFQNRLIGGDVFAQADEGSNHKYTHVDGSFASKNVRRHNRAIFCEGPGAIGYATVSAWNWSQIATSSYVW
jgi:hypothetical protein